MRKQKEKPLVDPSRKVSVVGQNLIKEFESLRLESYLCPAGVWTIGWGTTRIEEKPVVKGMKITIDQAQKYFEKDLQVFETAVSKLVSVKINQNQFDSLVSLCYNIGIGNFTHSSVLRFLNQEQYIVAAHQMTRWIYATVNGKKIILNGLVRRRAAEKDLFLSMN